MWEHDLNWPFPGEHVYPLTVTPDGRVWMSYDSEFPSTDAGLLSWDGANDVEVFPAPPNGEWRWGGLPHAGILDLKVKIIPGGYELWMSCVSRGIAVLTVMANNVVVVDSLEVTRGTLVSGGVAELAESDNADLSLRRATADIQSRTEFEVKAVSPVANPSSLEVTMEGSVFARSTVNQTIELYDYIAGAWEQVDTRAATRFIDSTVTVAATGDLARFVEAGTMCIKARIRYQSVNPRQQFSSNTDQFVWTIGQ